MRRYVNSLLTAAILTPVLGAQEPIDPAMVAKIKEEGINNSQVMDHIFYLTDVYGPRLANSPMYNRAGKWAVERLKSYGLENARLEPWGEVGDGWTYHVCPEKCPIFSIPDEFDQPRILAGGYTDVSSSDGRVGSRVGIPDRIVT